MKNAINNQLKKAIFLTENEFVDIFGRKYDVHFDAGFVQVFEESGENIDFIAILSEYFGVEVTSVHTDGCDILGIWVVYKEALTEQEEMFKEQLEEVYDASGMYDIDIESLSDEEISEMYDDVQETLANDDTYNDIYNDAVNAVLKRKVENK